MIRAALVCGAVLLACAMGAQAACPTPVCKADFSNALGGPIDCCKYSYSGPGAKCSWGGTPVSFTLAGTCTANGRQYLELKPSNFQGPPGQPNCRCKDPLPTPPPAAQCPAATCNSAFGNALGGPIDCCKYMYTGVGDRCWWGGTPVSFTLAGTCTANGQKYLELTPGNTQGPPGQANCRCKEPAGTPLPGPVAVPGFTVIKAQDITGRDLVCDGNKFCRVCGPPSAVAARCQSYQGSSVACAAFTYEPQSGCGYLKAAAGPTGPRGGWLTYTRNTITPTSGH